MVRGALGWGSRAKVIQPLELRELVLGQLQKTIRVYRQ
jgi:predicted DNA-binding transcriptional regulator YafY